MMGYAQCKIFGKSEVKIGELENFSVDIASSPCSDCYVWMLSNYLDLNGAKNQNTISIKANTVGKAVLSVLYKDSAGIEQTCFKELKIVENPTMIESSKEKEILAKDSQQPNTVSGSANQFKASPSDPFAVECDIEVTSLKEVKLDNGNISFFPQSHTGKQYSYLWEITYSNNHKEYSDAKLPEFPLLKDNPITSVRVKINSAKCIKTYTQEFKKGYWDGDDIITKYFKRE